MFVFVEFELYKLEQRYTKRKRRTTFISDAIYVEYALPPPPAIVFVLELTSGTVASTSTIRDSNRLRPRDPAFGYLRLLQVARVLHDNFPQPVVGGEAGVNDSPIRRFSFFFPFAARARKHNTIPRQIFPLHLIRSLAIGQ